jgi:hypothetical protein
MIEVRDNIAEIEEDRPHGLPISYKLGRPGMTNDPLMTHHDQGMSNDE